ncbi:phage integrase central domain-containing protein, partial [Klebsiella pneumoniae]|uniref:phage integrase central domain-containing protein n=1 Tax=Klebsiella pneumoniae TaxID=573 RepID=UPI003857EEA2
KGRDARKRAYCLKIQPATGSFARNLIYSTKPDLLKGIEEKGLLEVASRTRQHLSNIMRHAVHQELIDTNPAANLGGVTTPPVRRHYPALPLERLPELLERIGAYHQGRELTRLAVLLMLHVFIRSSELRFAR